MKNRQAELIQQMTDRQLYLQLILTQMILIGCAAILGFVLFSNWGELQEIYQLNDQRILTVGISAAMSVVLLDLVFIKLIPERYFDDGGINERIFGSLSIPHIFLIAALVAVSEEFLFRGVIQTNWGLWVTSVIFAIFHIRYLSNWFLFANILLLSFFIGFIYQWTGNLFVTIMMHFVIDLLLGLIIHFRVKHGVIVSQGEEKAESND